MARIISGLNPQEVNFAYLKGSEQGLGVAEGQRKERSEAEDRMMRNMQEIQRASLKHETERAKALELLNKQAQMGDAQALQRLALDVQRGLNPDQALLDNAMGTLSGIEDPDAYRLGVKAYGEVLDEVKRLREVEAATAAIDRAGADGLIDPEVYKERLASGEPTQNLTQELVELEQKKTIQTMAAQKAAQAIQQAQALIDATPQGPERLLAEATLTRYMNSPTDQAKPGSDAELIFDIQKALMESPAAIKKREKARLEAQEARRTSNRTMEMPESVGALGEATMPYRLHSERKPYEKPPEVKAMAARTKSEKEKRAKAAPAEPKKKRISYDTSIKAEIPSVRTLVLQTLDEADDTRGADVARIMRSNGIKVTPTNIQIARDAMREWRASRAPAGNAGR